MVAKAPASSPSFSMAPAHRCRVWRSDSTDNRALDADSVFEIGSITKVFTALLLADMIARGEVAASDPVAKFLPESVKVPFFESTPITLLILRPTRRACRECLPILRRGTPPIPTPITASSSFMISCRITSCASSPAPITNTPISGFGLLGHALALRAGMSYEELVISRICAPLGMDSTAHHAFTLDAGTAGAWPQCQSRSGGELGYPDAGRRRRAAFDRE